jgi:hypothetical protein
MKSGSGAVKKSLRDPSDISGKKRRQSQKFQLAPLSEAVSTGLGKIMALLPLFLVAPGECREGNLIELACPQS